MQGSFLYRGDIYLSEQWAAVVCAWLQPAAAVLLGFWVASFEQEDSDTLLLFISITFERPVGSHLRLIDLMISLPLSRFMPQTSNVVCHSLLM